MKYEGDTFSDEVVTVDDNEFVDCAIHNCTLSYGGGRFHFVRLTVTGTFALQFRGPAKTTLEYLQLLHSWEPTRQHVLNMLNPRMTDQAGGSRDTH